MEHPENNEKYKGLAVNSGVEQPSIINPYLKRMRVKRRELSAGEMVEGILKGNVTVLSQAVTLVESVSPAHRQKAQEVIDKCLPYSGKSVRIGISGVPSNLGTAIRTIVVLIMAWVMVFVTKKQGELKKIDRKSMFFIFLSGLTTGLSWLCYYKALQDGQASIVVPTDKLSILVTVAFSYIVLKEKLTKKLFLGLVLITAGTLLLVI